MWRTEQENGVHTINLTTTRTRTADSSSGSQQIAKRLNNDARTRRAKATRMISDITREMVDVALPLTAAIKSSLRTVL